MSDQHHVGHNSRNLPNNNHTDPSSYKPTMISDVLATHNDNTMSSSTNKKKHFSSATFRGLGCSASPQVSVPSVVRTSAHWEPATNSNKSSNSKVKKKRLKTHKNKFDCVVCNNNPDSKNSSFQANNVVRTTSQPSSLSLALSSSCVGAPDVWCGPVIGSTADAAAPVLDCVVSAPRKARERSYPLRRMVTHEDVHFLECEAGLVMPRFDRHLKINHRGGLAEILMPKGDHRMGNMVDMYRDMRLDVDNMSYEELLELGNRIGYVSTGLREDEISSCLTRTKLANFKDSSSLKASEAERKCSICQEEYEAEDEMGRLRCGHLFHFDCIKHWLAQKNLCPVCKTEAVSGRVIKL